MELIQTSEWKALQKHRQECRHHHLRDFFTNNPNRFDQFSYILDNNILFDFSKNYLTNKTIDLLIQLAKKRNLEEQISDLLSGNYYNPTENKLALHIALRDPNPKSFTKVSDNIFGILEKMWRFVEKIHNGTWRGCSNETITDVVHVGIGGSLQGPMMVTKALSNCAPKMNIHFVSTLDGEQTANLFKKINPVRTIFIIVSKSFKTEETLTNALILKEWFIEQVSDPHAYKKHFLGISANSQAMTEFGISPDNQFEFWDFVGGRYSVWSAVSLVVALAIGSESFDALLRGAYKADQHFLNEPLESNIPVIMGLLTVWYRNFMNFTSQVIMPYDVYLEHFPMYLQQLEMESCGKRVTQEGTAVNYETGQVIWGDIGSNGEHSFFQLLHQGTDIIPIDFIVPIHSVHNLNHSQDLVLSHALGQAQALMLGKEKNHENAKSILPHQTYPGNKPSTMILFPSLTAERLGALMACYEHKVFVQSVIWDINPFDQWGVDLGKCLSKKILSIIRHADIAQHSIDTSTEGLINFINLNK